MQISNTAENQDIDSIFGTQKSQQVRGIAIDDDSIFSFIYKNIIIKSLFNRRFIVGIHAATNYQIISFYLYHQDNVIQIFFVYT